LFILTLQLVAFSGNSDKEKTNSKTIACKITDNYGEALVGTKIVVKETGETFFTDLDGTFKLSFKADQVYSISIETIGYHPKEVKTSDLSLFSELSLKEL
jgi:hypothetical protein